MIVNKYSNGGGGGGTDVSTVKRIVDSAITEFSGELQEGQPIVGMAEQLYSPDGVTSEGAFTYRTTAGDADVSSAPAELRKIEGNSIYPELQYNDSAVLEREGEPVTGFTYDIEWGNSLEWVAYGDDYYTVTAATLSNRSQKMKFSRTSNSGKLFITVAYDNGQSPNYSDISINFTTTGLTANNSSTATAVTPTQLVFATIGIEGTIDYDGTDIVAEITASTHTDAFIRNVLKDSGAAGVVYYSAGVNIPNDIPNGETTYTYSSSDSAWTSTLPQALQNMKVDGSDYVPQDGDEITITRSPYREGRAQFSTPKAFVALGLNSFNKDSATTISDFTEDNGVYTVYVYAVAGLENGYVVYSQNSGITAAGIGSGKTDTMDSATTTYGESLSIVYPTTAKPYIIVTTTDIDGLCIHPRWSGYNDEVYEPYEESKVDGLLNLMVTNNTYLWSVGDVRNIIDVKNGQIIRNISSEEYSAARVNELIASGLTIGTDFDFDDTLIYMVLDTPIVSPITLDGSYNANDFGVEYFVDANGIIPTPLYAETYYMNNLVDKLRRIEGIVHLNSLSGTGNENTIYECDNQLWYWKDSDGPVAEWTDDMSVLGHSNGYGLIFSHIPDGQTIFEAKYSSEGDEHYKSIKLSGDTLVVLNSGGTVLSACTLGSTAEFRVRSNSSSSYWVRVKVLKHWIGFELSSNINVRNLWNGQVVGGHFGIVDHTNYPYMSISNTANGIPKWNSKGQIIHQDATYQAKTIYFNTTGYSNNFTAVATSANGPQRMFVPTQSGIAGQVLTSAGNAEPTWETLIKSVKITSDAYEALQTKDPNTLYCIVDE